MAVEWDIEGGNPTSCLEETTVAVPKIALLVFFGIFSLSFLMQGTKSVTMLLKKNPLEVVDWDWMGGIHTIILEKYLDGYQKTCWYFQFVVIFGLSRSGSGKQLKVSPRKTVQRKKVMRESDGKAKQKAQTHCDIFRQKDVERIDRTHNKWFLDEILSEKMKPLFFLFDSFLCHFLL